ALAYPLGRIRLPVATWRVWTSPSWTCQPAPSPAHVRTRLTRTDPLRDRFVVGPPWRAVGAALVRAYPRERAAELVGLVGRQAERAGDVADRALAAVADHRRRECGAFASVLGVQILDHLFAAIVFEIDVDVR